MPDLRLFASTSNVVRFIIKDKTTGQNKTGLSLSTSGLIVSTIADNEATATAYTAAGSTIETIATLGTFATPTATKCRFKEVDSTNHKGLYEFQFADARFAVTSAKRLVISVNDGESTILDVDYEIELTQFNPFDAVRMGLTALPNVAAGASGGLPLSVDASGRVDVLKINGTSQTARDLGASVLLSSGTGTGQLDFTSGVVKANATQWLGGTIPAVSVTGVPLVDVKYLLGTAWLTPGTAGTPDVNVKLWNALATVALPLAPTVAGRTLDVSAGGEAGVDWANVGSPTTTLALTGTTIATTQHVIADSGTVTTVTNQLTAAQVATGVWQDATAGDFTTAGSIGKSLYTAGAVPGAANGLFIAGTNAATTITTGLTTTFTGNLTGSVASVGGAVGSVTGAVGSVTAAVTVGTLNAGVVTAASIASAALDGKGDWLLAADYTAPDNTDIATLITQVGVLVNTRIPGVVQPQTGDAYARIGAFGAGLTAVGDTRLANLDATVSSRTKPADTQAAVTVVGSVTGAVGSVGTGGITAASFAAGAINAAAIAADADAEIAAGVWDLAVSGHTASGSFGAAVNAAGSVGDPWGTGLPGSYGPGTAGFIVGTYLDAAMSSRTKPADTQAAVTTATNLTNAPTAGDFTAAMKTSLNAATPAVTVSDKTGFKLAADGLALVTTWTVAITGNIAGNLSGSVGSVTGNVGGNVTGSVGSVTGAVGSVTGNVGGSVASVTAGVTVATNNDKTGYSLTVAPPTAAAIATAIFTDTTASDFTTAGSPGKVLVSQLGGTFTTTSSSVFTALALANAPGISGDVTVGSLTAAALAQFFTTDSGTSYASSVSGSVVKEIGGNASSLTIPDVQTALTNQGYTTVRAPKLDELDAAVSSRASASTQPAWYIAPVDVSTAVGAIQAQTDQFVFTVAGRVDATATVDTAGLAAAFWTDQEPSHFAVDGTPGKILVHQLGGAFTSQSSSVFTAEALVLAPGGTVSGHGKIAVDHNYGGTDALTVVTATSTPVGDAFITAYLRIDYEAGHHGPEFVAGQTTTDAHGRWRFHLLLDEGEYILLITKPGVIAPKVVAVTVAA